MLELYISETCPYSRKVMNFLEENEIKYVKHDVSNAGELASLVEIGGMEQVPFLFDTDTDEKMYESEDIIAYIQDKKDV